jgi:manganese/zinc/iron transport system ATP- binding protein
MNLLKWPTKAIKERALQIMQDLGMKEFASCHISELSGGQKQKLFIGRALMQKATLYLLDEPFVGIDHTTQEQLITLFKKMRDEGKTLVIVHHDLNSAQEIFDSIVLLNTYLVAAGPTKSVFNMENLKKAYGQSETLLEQLLKVSKGKKGL